MSRTRAGFALTLAVLLAPSLSLAQFDTDHPGYFPIEELAILPQESINLEINLPAAMLRFIAVATDEEEPELSKITRNLESIRVRGADLTGASLDSVRSGFETAARQLQEKGWTSMVRMREDNEEVNIFFKEEEGEMVGLTVLTINGEEAMLINLVGKIDPADLAGLAEGLDLDLPRIETPDNTAEPNS